MLINRGNWRDAADESGKDVMSRDRNMEGSSDGNKDGRGKSSGRWN